MRKIFLIFLLISFFISTGCQNGEKGSGEKAVEEKSTKSDMAPGEPERVEVQHILISFQGTIPDEKVIRTKEDAEILAKEILARARAGEDFDSLVKEYTDDQHPGIYRMSNSDVMPDSTNQEFSRDRMVKAFGDVSFSLNVGEV
ncbi:MAG: peptidylprolyl isomerase, partial [Candidatus Aminicenantes bacterium]